MHITSLPNRYTLGTFSREAYSFIDWLASGDFKVWQVLPITDCGYGASPYSARSTYAINPSLIDISQFLDENTLNNFGFNKWSEVGEQEERIERALDLIYDRFRMNVDISEFEKKNKLWLNDYALYKVIKNKYDKVSWLDFPLGLRNREKNAIAKFQEENSRDIDKVKFIQYIANSQWMALKKYANDKGVEILGDMPFYVEMDSADVWANPSNWKLEKSSKGQVAGVPPDYFNKDGQLWGNPIYNYENMAKDGYKFFVNRFKRQGELFDIVRVDHFIAFARYWSIPSSSTTATKGKWVKGYGDVILKEILKKTDLKIIAEDLGIVTKEVYDLRCKFNIPGLKVLQFAFDGDGDNMYQPHNYEKNCVAYIGTHDNDTFMGLLNHSDWDKINRFKRYLRIPLEWGNDAVVDNAIITLYRSSANMIILTMQDILKLDSDARMNIPGVVGGRNWLWQLDGIPDIHLSDFYRELSSMYAR